jgi:enoyl-CoA hydratase/carnithine racemase
LPDFFRLTKENNIFVLTMKDEENENTFTLDVLKEYNELLNEIESSQENESLIVTSSLKKTWHNGLNIKWVLKQPPEIITEFSEIAEDIIVRTALLNLPTIGCITGNCYGGGAIMASGLDFRYMRDEKGRICLPGITHKIVYSESMHEIIALLPNKHALNEMALTGRAIEAKECLERNIVDAIWPKEILFEKTMEFANMLSEKDRKTYNAIKRGLRKSIVLHQKSRKRKKDQYR